MSKWLKVIDGSIPKTWGMFHEVWVVYKGSDWVELETPELLNWQDVEYWQGVPETEWPEFDRSKL